MNKAILSLNLFKKSLLILVATVCFVNLQAAITVLTPLPANLTKCEGDSLILSVSISSDYTVDYVWKRNGNVIGSNSPVLILPTLSITDTGTYSCEMKEQTSGATEIQSCHVLVNLKPNIISHPSGSISPLCEGNTLTLTASVQNATLVWMRNTTVLATGTNTYTNPSITVDDSGSYTVLARAAIGCKDVVTNPFPLTVRSRVKLLDTFPTKIRMRDGAGMSYSYRMHVAGDGPFSYQWFKNNSPIPGANDDSFKIYSFVSAIDSGFYKVCVSSTAPCSDVVCSNMSEVTPSLCPLLISQTDTLVNACLGGPVTIEVNAVGVKEPNGYQWFKDINDSLEGAVYPRFYIISADSNTAGYYNVVLRQDTGITEDCSQVDVFKRVHVVVNPRQMLTTQPVSNSKCDATSHTLTASASNAMGYQWYKDGIAISGATDSFYTVNPVTTDVHSYKVHALNPYCTDEPSNSVLVRQLNPSNNVKLTISQKINLVEQCTDNEGWTYYADSSNYQDLLFAVNKNGNNLVFSPDIKFTNGYIQELAANPKDQEVVFMGLRMFNIKLADTTQADSLKHPYSVKFYFNSGPSEAGLFLSTIQSRRSTLLPLNQFSTDLPLNELSFVTSTHDYMDKQLVYQGTTAPISFPYNVVNDKSFGMDNSVDYVQINNLVTTKGGGTFYFHYFQKAASSISNNAPSEKLSIYPNPSRGNLTVNLGGTNSKEVKLSIYNLLGKEVRTIDFDRNTRSKNINCSDLPNGNYIFQIDNGTEQINKKVIISK